ncbi:hypothetical protein A3L12_01950 [Thermococcus sp. P6]|uniref:hypothetical protein n=1 Tax=Thermococcus sp. P6 TaxID=122420 RepID=UPI000B59E139|nr:hypothetical protein [Thermococcus sp. P6]ASJ10144.1 hypothetical protein A3L12_01950 [Thermococcus sp. P6]
MLSVGGVNVRFTGELDDGFREAFKGLFARRYLPDVTVASGDPDVLIERFRGDDFRVFGAIYDVLGVDRYKLEAGVPSAYGNEAPVFFLLQAVARAGMKKSLVFLTDSVSIVRPDGKAVLFVGYPHTGKSTISALALAKGLTVLSTENTVIEARDGKLNVVGGTDVLVYDPSVERFHHLRIPHDTQTRSGYRIKDLSGDSERRNLLREGVEVDKIVVLHAAFHCTGASFSAIKGRKVRKTLWYFSTALMKGLDYYEPMPLHVPMTDEIRANLRDFLHVASSAYSKRMFEAFGGHGEIFERTFGMSLR